MKILFFVSATLFFIGLMLMFNALFREDYSEEDDPENDQE
jgi:hypothetical protein